MTTHRKVIAKIRELQTEIMRQAPYRDIGLVPNPGASNAAIAAAEARVGMELPKSYRDFLKSSDGWPRFFEGATLLGTANLGLRCHETLVEAAFEAAETPVPEGPRSRKRPARRLIAFGVDLQATTLFAFDASRAASGDEFEVVAWINEIGVRRPNFLSFLELIQELAEAELESSRLALLQKTA